MLLQAIKYLSCRRLQSTSSRYWFGFFELCHPCIGAAVAMTSKLLLAGADVKLLTSPADCIIVLRNDWRQGGRVP